jgi:hypothetical protein
MLAAEGSARRAVEMTGVEDQMGQGKTVDAGQNP